MVNCFGSQINVTAIYINFNILRKSRLNVLFCNQFSSFFDFKIASQQIIEVTANYFQTNNFKDVQKVLIID